METELQGLKQEAKTLAEPSLILERAPYGIWTEKKRNHSALFQPSAAGSETEVKTNLVHRTLGAVKTAVGAMAAFVMDVSTWFSTLVESGGVGFL